MVDGSSSRATALKLFSGIYFKQGGIAEPNRVYGIVAIRKRFLKLAECTMCEK